jgi:hypothetical protein
MAALCIDLREGISDDLFDQGSASGAVAATALHELVSAGRAEVRWESFAGDYWLEVSAPMPMGPEPIIYINSDSINDCSRALGDALGNLECWLPWTSSRRFARGRDAFASIRDTLQNELAGPDLDRALDLLSGIEASVRQLETASFSGHLSSPDDESVRWEYDVSLARVSRDNQDRVSALDELLCENGLSDLAEQVTDGDLAYAHSADEGSSNRVTVTPTEGPLSWDGLSADQQVSLILQLNEEHHPSAFLAAELISRHPGTHESAVAALALTALWSERAWLLGE